MIRTGEQYRAGLRDDREVWIDGERVKDVPSHPSLKPIALLEKLAGTQKGFFSPAN